jgi:glycosyltransferase involved in cell wall biosynthesis
VLDEVRPDVVHAQSLVYLGLGLIRAAEARRIPVVMTLHEYFLACPRGGILWNLDGELCDPIVPAVCARCIAPYPIERARYPDPPEGGAGGELRFFERAIVERTRRLRAGVQSVRRFVAPSKFLAERMAREGLDARRIVVSDYGFPAVERPQHPAQAPRRPGAPLRLGFLGTIADYKGVHVAVEAVASLDPSVATLVVRGALDWFPDYTAPLLERTRNMRHVTFEGPLPFGASARFLAGLDALVVPSLWYENSPLTIHEAFQCGVPVLVSDLGGMAELVAGGGGLAFRRGDAADLARCIRRLRDEPGLLAALAAGIPPVKSIERNADEMAELYRAALSSGAEVRR